MNCLVIIARFIESFSCANIGIDQAFENTNTDESGSESFKGFHAYSSWPVLLEASQLT